LSVISINPLVRSILSDTKPTKSVICSVLAFLEAIEKHLGIEKSPISSLFEEDPGFLTAHSYHTGLLWALENLAWFPQYLSRASLILAKLSAIDPGGNLSNRPINSLSEIFKSWHFQTLASFDERMQVLKLISEREPEIAWTILIRMLPDLSGGIGHPTHKTRWRMFELETEKAITYNEIYATHSAVVEMLISIFDFTEAKLAKLIEEKTDQIRKENKDFYKDLESTIKIKLDDNKSEIKNLIENERNQIKQIFEIEFAKNTKELKQVIEAENKTIKVSIWVIGGLTLILSLLAVIKIWT